MVREIADSHDLLVSLEENAIMGGAGSAVSEFLARENVLKSVFHLGLPEASRTRQARADAGRMRAGRAGSKRPCASACNC